MHARGASRCGSTSSANSSKIAFFQETMANASHGMVVFLPLSKANFLEMLPIAKMMQSAGRLRPVFCLDSKRAGLTSAVHMEKMEAIAPDGFAAYDIRHDGPRTRRQYGDSISGSSITKTDFRSPPLAFPISCRSVCRAGAHPEIICKALRHSPYHRCGRQECGNRNRTYCRRQSQSIPSLIVPFAMSFPEAAAEPRLRIGQFQQKIRRAHAPAQVGTAMFSFLGPRP